MFKKLTYVNGYRWGGIPISYQEAVLIAREHPAECMRQQIRAFKILAERLGW